VDHMLLLFTSLESNCGVICSPFQKNPPKKSGHFIIILYSAKHDFFSVYEHVLRSYLFFIILFSSEFYRLVNTAIALDKREKKCQEIMCPVLYIAAFTYQPIPFSPAFPLIYKICRKLCYDVSRPFQLKLVLRLSN